MVVAKCQLYGVKPIIKESVFDIVIDPTDVLGGFFQLHLRVGLRKGCSSYTIDWGDGVKVESSNYDIRHNYTKSGTYTVRVGETARWWRLYEGYAVRSDGRAFSLCPTVHLKCWSDYLESVDGTFCGWNYPDDRGVVGSLIEWGKSIEKTFCCYQFLPNLTGSVPPWTEAIVDATGTYDECSNLSGFLPTWGPNIEEVTQCFKGCSNIKGEFKPWPQRCKSLDKCFMNASSIRGVLPQWPKGVTSLVSVYEGCVNASGNIPEWPEVISSISRCYYGCKGLTGAWTEEPELLMPESKMNDNWNYTEVVAEASDSLRALFYDQDWGGLKPHPSKGEGVK